jgi:hypothetical protein
MSLHMKNFNCNNEIKKSIKYSLIKHNISDYDLLYD